MTNRWKLVAAFAALATASAAGAQDRFYARATLKTTSQQSAQPPQKPVFRYKGASIASWPASAAATTMYVMVYYECVKDGTVVPDSTCSAEGVRIPVNPNVYSYRPVTIQPIAGGHRITTSLAGVPDAQLLSASSLCTYQSSTTKPDWTPKAVFDCSF